MLQALCARFASLVLSFYSGCLNGQLTMERSAAEILALRALAWAASDGETLAEFLRISGVEPQDLRARAGSAELLAAFMDFVLAGDAVAERLCAAENISPEMLHRARRALPGAVLP